MTFDVATASCGTEEVMILTVIRAIPPLDTKGHQGDHHSHPRLLHPRPSPPGVHRSQLVPRRIKAISCRTRLYMLALLLLGGVVGVYFTWQNFVGMGIMGFCALVAIIYGQQRGEA